MIKVILDFVSRLFAKPKEMEDVPPGAESGPSEELCSGCVFWEQMKRGD